MACKINGQFLKHLNKNPSLIESGSRVKHPSLLQFYEWSRLMVLKCQKINVNKINSVFIWHSRLLSWIATHLTVSGKWLSLKAITTSLIEYGGVKQLWVRRDQIRTNAGEPTWSQTHDLMWLCWAWTDKKKSLSAKNMHFYTINVTKQNCKNGRLPEISNFPLDGQKMLKKQWMYKLYECRRRASAAVHHLYVSVE